MGGGGGREGGEGRLGELTFGGGGGDKNLVRGRSLLGGDFSRSGGRELALFSLVGKRLTPPHCREDTASSIWQISWTWSGMAENDKSASK